MLVSLAVLPFTQPEQPNRRRVERLMAAGRIDDALRFMSARERADFPPHWDVPPRIGYGQRASSLTDVVQATFESHVAEWVRSMYHEKFTY